jgi:hypothetical protein
VSGQRSRPCENPDGESPMRFHYGPIPESPDFQPQEEGWTPLVEPSVTVFTWLASGVGIIVGLVAAFVWAASVPNSAVVQVSVGPGQSPIIPLATQLAIVLGAIALLIVVHELLHALVHPGGMLTGRTILGAWLTKGLFYAHYDGPLSRERFLLILVMPFLVLTGGLWLVAMIFRPGWAILPAWSVLNAMFAGGDLLATGMIAWQVPRGAEMRNQGWKTWWRTA